MRYVFAAAFSALVFILALTGCVSVRSCDDRLLKAQTADQARCNQDLDRLAAECAEVASQDAPIYGRNGYGADQKAVTQ